MTTINEMRVCVPAYQAGYRFEISDKSLDDYTEICVSCFEDSLKCSNDSDRVLTALLDYENDLAKYMTFDREILTNGGLKINGRVKVKSETSTFFRQRVVNSLMTASLMLVQKHADYLSGQITWEEVFDGTAAE